MTIRLIFRLTRHPATVTEPPSLEIFRANIENSERPWLPMLGSLAAHVALVFLISVVSRQLANYYADDFDWRSYRAEPLRIRVPELLYYSAQTKPPRQKRSDQTATFESESGRPVNTKDLELPPLERSDTATVTILQPDTPPEIAVPDPKIPSLAFWARRNSVRLKRLSDQIAMPGRAEQPGPPPRLASRPVLAVSNLEAEMGERNIAAATGRSSISQLPDASATAPVRDLHSETRAGTFDSFAGEPTNLITFSAATIRPGEVVTVPPTSHSGAVQEGGGIGRAGGDRLAPPGINSSAETGSPAGPGTSETQRQSVESIAGPRFEMADVKTPRVDAPGAETFTRIMHPAAGNFDVVITRPGGRDDLNGSGALRGSPVYTVYLRVGDEKEWTLEFCPPSVAQPQNNSYHVYVEDPTPLTAPYPVTTIIPNSILRVPRSATVVFHGFLTTAGRFRDMEPDKIGGTAESVASVLRDWQFRPASRREVPIEVEVLLIVPAPRPGELM